jgi:AcrR family transcriptional regulator
MGAPRRIGSETSETRSTILDTVERIMLRDGYAAVSSRRIAKEAGVTPALVHYYFGTLDDLFIAALRRRGDEQRERQQRILDSPQPLRALWRFSSDQSGTGLLLEFMALANHRKAIRTELARYADEFRAAQLDALRSRLAELGLDDELLPPSVLLVLSAALSRTLVMEESLGIEVGVAEARAAVEAFLERFEGPAPPRRTKR